MQQLNNITKALNNAIASNQKSQENLKNLNNCVVLFIIEDFDKKLYFKFHHDQVIVYADYNQAVDLTIKGRSMALLGMSPLAKHAAKDSWPKEIAITGDLQIAELIRAWLNNTNIDLALLLSPYLGDSLSYSITQSLGVLAKSAIKIKRSLEEQTMDWVQNDSKTFVSELELNGFLDDVDQIKLSAARLKARIEFLEEG